VVGEAGDGEEAIARALELEPDVITMDVRMPRRNGLEAIREIMRLAPRPIVVISNAVVGPNEQISFQALKLGALEVLPKPDALQPHHFAVQAEAIRQAVRSVAGLARGMRRDAAGEEWRAPLVTAPTAAHAGPPACVGIGASTGGPPALQKSLSALPGDYPAPILVVQHIAEGFVDGLARWIGGQCALNVRLAREGEVPEPRTVLFAPDRRHLMISMGRVRLDDSAPVKGLKPSVTLLFASLAREFGSRAVGLLLTGMGDDGAAGLKLMRERGALTVAQGPRSSIVWGMPRVAVETGAAVAVLELEAISEALLGLARGEGPSS
jgi:two-component system chemotaxis response regulator CheB